MKKLSLLFIVFSLFSCEKEGVICDTSFRSLNLYVRDTLEYVVVRDINLGNVLYSDRNVYNQFKVVDDSYLNIMGVNNQTTLNIEFRYVNDSIYKRVSPVCIFTDECHINFYYPSDTLLL
jgi:hypothetical protein